MNACRTCLIVARFQVAGLLACLSAAPVLAFGDPDPELITPWFELQRHAPLIDVPHTFLSSLYTATARVKVAGEWKQVLHATSKVGPASIRPVAFNRKRSVFVGRGFEDPVIFTEGEEKPITLTSTDCHSPRVRSDGESILCMETENADGKPSGLYSPAVRVRMDVLDPKGKRVEQMWSSIPPEFATALPYGAADLIGWSLQGMPIIQSHDFKTETCAALQLDPAGAHMLKRVKAAQCPSDWTPLLQDPAIELPPAPQVVGRWRYAGATFMGVAIEMPVCPFTVEYRADGTMTEQTGEQIMTARYRIERFGMGYLLVRSGIEFNGKPSCGGRSSAEAAKVALEKWAIEGSGQTLWMNVPFTTARGRYVQVAGPVGK